jgi:hypothetical protein
VIDGDHSAFERIYMNRGCSSRWSLSSFSRESPSLPLDTLFAFTWKTSLRPTLHTGRALQRGHRSVRPHRSVDPEHEGRGGFLCLLESRAWIQHRSWCDSGGSVFGTRSRTARRGGPKHGDRDLAENSVKTGKKAILVDK